MSALSYLARRFVAGERREDAMRALKFLSRDGLLATMDFLGENVTNEAEARNASEEYLRLLDAIRSTGIVSHVSLKLTQMGLDLGEDFCFGVVSRILERAKEHGNFLRVDMEGSAYTERTLRVYRRLFERYGNVGIVLQAYLHRTENDAVELARIQAPVRLCKGAYKEPASLAFQNMNDIRTHFRRVTELLIRGGSRVAIATHDETLIRWAVDWTSQEEIPRDRFEFQMLYGIRRRRALALARLGYGMRQYVPYGAHWFPYFYRRLRERKENVFFVLRNLLD